jgi:hypothetical protein
MGTWEHGNMGIDEVAWEHQLGNKTTACSNQVQHFASSYVSRSVQIYGPSHALSGDQF